MARPSKPSNIIRLEKKSHRTKAELAERERNEKNLLSNTPIKKRKEVKDNKFADKEYNRIIKLLKKIDKNDALYEAIINRYCIIQAECNDLVERREEFYNLTIELKNDMNNFLKNADISDNEKVEYRFNYTRELQKMMASVLACDKDLDVKRKQLITIEKECALTIASALRTIPKTPEQKSNDLLKILGGGL